MITTEVIDELAAGEQQSTSPAKPKFQPGRRVAVGVAVLVATIGTTIAVTQGGGDAAEPVTTSAPASPSTDEIVRSLVDRGVVPAATLDDGSQIVTAPAAASRDDIVQALVARGLVPAATLDNGSQVAG